MSDPFKIQQGTLALLNIAAATIVKLCQNNYDPVRCVRISVIVAGSGPGTANDAAVTTGALPANQFFTIPNIVGTYLIDWPCLTGLLIVPGTGQTVAVTYD